MSLTSWSNVCRRVRKKNAENISLRIFAGGSIFHLGNLLWEADEVGGEIIRCTTSFVTLRNNSAESSFSKRQNIISLLFTYFPSERKHAQLSLIFLSIGYNWFYMNWQLYRPFLVTYNIQSTLPFKLYSPINTPLYASVQFGVQCFDWG